MISEIYFQYICYVLGFLGLLLLQLESSRLLWLHSISTIIGLIANYEMKFYILLAMFHSAIHNLWPFLKNTGYDDTEKSVYDVICHTIMVTICYHRIYYTENAVINNYITFHLFSIIFIVGALINCAVSHIAIGSNNRYLHSLFEYTTIFQALSTGYWVATMLWYHHLDDNDFYNHWIIWISLMTINWFIYKFYPDLVGISMRYKYVEAVFIVCTWHSGLISSPLMKYMDKDC
ncbi:hypothetical protein QJ850_gp897 [Acanthamoeba polyphaga mimivirus]|uniref:Transmembrane protein n=1 Tax=Acanthamoeba polyphaga mimivirus Kroon TaxID=3069720 RepID=A0A0G2Y7K5_9VIRU|nr:hypothetical protein QJ850_gp897 [Acanthamoeba polyphaga mimivirus]AKI79802.1 hypothetical protein [Acanthamoeba polyphaga mimivirus Kroon]